MAPSLVAKHTAQVMTSKLRYRPLGMFQLLGITKRRYFCYKKNSAAQFLDIHCLKRYFPFHDYIAPLRYTWPNWSTSPKNLRVKTTDFYIFRDCSNKSPKKHIHQDHGLCHLRQTRTSLCPSSTQLFSHPFLEGTEKKVWKGQTSIDPR